jgi:hypothetical protein
MKLISHRGNLNGPDKNFENSPLKINLALEKGYDCEVDLWAFESEDGKVNFSLGHDSPDYLIQEDWLSVRKNELWIHCKNMLALSSLSESEHNFNFFWHNIDNYTLTSHGFIWVYPGLPVPRNGILVLPENNNHDLIDLNKSRVYGVCSDFVGEMH